MGKVANDDICTLKNTILKMAKKRAKIDAVIAVTRSSGIFTQDMEDIVDHDTTDGSGTKAAAQRVLEQKLETAKTKKAEKASTAIPSLFYVHTPSGFYEIMGDEGYKSANRDLLKQFWQPNAKAILVNDEQLEGLKFHFEERKVPFSLLKEPNAR